mmetsp:Transcript_18915/g.26345  ORF Transcript_18915/g.26345 Transcript_18915/m.26345 type:complete len:205 (+) Transcript_18915:1315-1929(+)
MPRNIRHRRSLSLKSQHVPTPSSGGQTTSVVLHRPRTKKEEEATAATISDPRRCHDKPPRGGSPKIVLQLTVPLLLMVSGEESTSCFDFGSRGKSRCLRTSHFRFHEILPLASPSTHGLGAATSRTDAMSELWACGDAAATQQLCAERRRFQRETAVASLRTGHDFPNSKPETQASMCVSTTGPPTQLVLSEGKVDCFQCVLRF